MNEWDFVEYIHITCVTRLAIFCILNSYCVYIMLRFVYFISENHLSSTYNLTAVPNRHTSYLSQKQEKRRKVMKRKPKKTNILQSSSLVESTKQVDKSVYVFSTNGLHLT